MLTNISCVQGCSCNQQLMGLLPMVGVTPAQIQFGESIAPDTCNPVDSLLSKP
jgi:hypothetical protein